MKKNHGGKEHVPEKRWRFPSVEICRAGAGAGAETKPKKKKVWSGLSLSLIIRSLLFSSLNASMVD